MCKKFDNKALFIEHISGILKELGIDFRLLDKSPEGYEAYNVCFFFQYNAFESIFFLGDAFNDVYYIGRIYREVSDVYLMFEYV